MKHKNRNVMKRTFGRAPSEDSDQTAHAQSDQNLYWPCIE